jgi:magnesium transporter
VKVNNPLTSNLLREHPHDAARVLEELPAASAAELLETLPVNLAAPVLGDMLTRYAAECLACMDISAAQDLLAELPEALSARLLRLLNPVRRHQLLRKLRLKQRTLIEYQMSFREGSVGAFMDVAPLLLPDGITIAHAWRRIERSPGGDAAEIFVVDDNNHLSGAVRAEALLRSERHAPIASIMLRSVPSLSVQANIRGLDEHVGWRNFRSLPVTDRDHTVLGVLSYTALVSALRRIDGIDPEADEQPVLSIVEMSWIVLADLISSIAPLMGRRR